MREWYTLHDFQLNAQIISNKVLGLPPPPTLIRQRCLTPSEWNTLLSFMDAK